jgi:protein TonB
MYRPPVGVPRREQSRWQGWVASLLAHLLLLLLVIVPTMEPAIDYGHREGAGGAGPAGGGGGGLGDAGAPRIHFVQVAPEHAAAPPTAPPVQPVPKPVTPTVAPPPLPVTPKPVVPQPTPAAPATNAAQTATAGPTGSGTGIGKNGGAGAGPGSGGGVGSGEGPGTGSGTGPGTGGGNAKNYPPTPRQFFLPPLPPPSSVRGFHLTAWFDVDSTGRATLLRFTPTPDGGYNRQLRESLLGIRFRPAVRPDGTPIRDTVDVQYTF